ncbi:WD40 repeat-like protein [Paxillus ammoniavirescens]|nr:WD40 repeat-like protein [Paxillus ammoniavirescens]
MSQKDAIDAKPLTTIPGHDDTIRNIVYLPGEKRIVTCSQDKTVRIWDVETGEQEGTSMEQESLVRCLAVTRDGTKILSGGEDGRIRVWDVTTHEPIERWGTHTGAILSIDLSPDDRLAASGHRYGQIVIREVKESGRIKHSVMAGGSVRSVCFSPDGEKLACAVTDHLADNGVYVIQVYDVESGELVLGPMKGHDNEICCVLWSLDGNQFFSGSKDETIRCWNCITSEPIGQPWTGHTHIVASLSLSPDGSKLASASLDKTVRFWDAHSGDPIEQPLQHNGCPRAVTFSPSGQFVASGGYDRKLSIWRVPWWGDSHKEAPARNSFLDLPAVPVPKGPANSQQQGELDFLDVSTVDRSHHPLDILSTLPIAPQNLP